MKLHNMLYGDSVGMKRGDHDSSLGHVVVKLDTLQSEIPQVSVPPIVFPCVFCTFHILSRIIFRN